MATYKAVMRPALEYASSVWSPIASSTSINKLQVMQNAALRTATGCTQDTNIQHLHDETITLPIHEHLQLHASQYKQKTQHPSHPLHKHTRRTLAQLRTNKSPFLKSYLHKFNAKTHASPLCPLCNIHTHDTHLFNCTHIRTTLSPPGFVDRPCRSDCTAGQIDGEAGWWTTNGNIGLPPLARVMGVGRQHNQYNTR